VHNHFGGPEDLYNAIRAVAPHLPAGQAFLTTITDYQGSRSGVLGKVGGFLLSLQCRGRGKKGYAGGGILKGEKGKEKVKLVCGHSPVSIVRVREFGFLRVLEVRRAYRTKFYTIHQKLFGSG
jgi:hypothetical protein